MFAGVAGKLAMKKLGINSKTFDFSSPSPDPPRETRKLKKSGPPDNDDDESNKNWPTWLSVKSLPITVQPWLAPAPAAVAVGECPRVGDLAPIDRDRKLAVGGGRKVLVVFLRCVGCAFAQKTFLNLRAIANRYPNLSCIAVSHSSQAATQKWLDLMGGAWNVRMVIDEDRAIYAAWGLGSGSFWSVMNPNTQIQAWKETGWLGNSVATSIQRTKSIPVASAASSTAASEPPADGPGPVMGNKWQEAGAFAVDGRGTVVWGAKALRADDILDLNMAVMALEL